MILPAQPAARPDLTLGSPLWRNPSPISLSEGNQVTLLAGGAEAFPAMLSAIAQAQSTVWLESYIIASDTTGRNFFDALIAAAQRGCKVRLMGDGFGCFGIPASWFEELEQAGGQTHIYRPPMPWHHGWGLWHRDHRKILVVDQQIGFVGGVNLADEYDQRTEIGKNWRDLHMRIDGPAATALAHLFSRTWNSSAPSHKLLDGYKAIPGVAQGGVPVAIIGNHETGHRFLIRRSFLHMTRRAQKSIIFANPYFIPDTEATRALCRAARAGVDVRIVIPERSDVRIIDLASRATLPRLLAAGVHIAQWPGMMHAKAASVDQIWASVGSYNLDRRALHFNLEVTANIYDPAFAKKVDETLREHFSAAHELDLDQLKQRSLWERVLSQLAYRLRALL